MTATSLVDKTLYNSMRIFDKKMMEFLCVY